jgi:signal transduction histidine kinase
MSSTFGDRVDRWMRKRPPGGTLGAVPYLLLAIIGGLTLPLDQTRGPALVAGVSLCAAAALWMLAMYTLRPAWRQRPRPMAVFVAGLIVITGALIVVDSWFGFFAAVCFSFSRALLPWPRQQAGAAATAVLAALSQTVGVSASLAWHILIFIFVLGIDLLFLCSLMWLLWQREEQIARNERTVAELSAANGKLEATIAENDDLHRQLLAQAREAGMLDERRRMAREIHDTLAQGLTGIVTQLQAAVQAAGQAPPELAPASPAGWQRHVTAATQLARDSLSEARRSVDALRPPPLEEGRLSEALASLAERWTAVNQVPVQVTTTGSARPIAPEAGFALLRAAQEALANVARHARASRVGLTISYMENEVALDVRDDGVGFDPGRCEPGFGLVAMRQRIAALSGTLQVESEPGGGTAVSACVPTVTSLAAS